MEKTSIRGGDFPGDLFFKILRILFVFFFECGEGVVV